MIMSHDTAGRIARAYSRAGDLERNQIAADSSLETRAIIREHLLEHDLEDYDRRCLEQDDLEDEDSGWEQEAAELRAAEEACFGWD